ncbi:MULTISPECIES: hypothetical protein [Microbacterium]|uniref:hypothetical protein n=1 Tax=Microbacterium TaxID=33882 RepID=UPI000D65132E|nr:MULTISPECIES: hypothetical protein [Microbacterium]
MQMTLRDERMLDWLRVVRLADMDAVRWALAGLDEDSQSTANEPRPVSLRRAQQWVARLVEAGLLDRGRPTFRDGSIVWATFQVTGKARPNLFKQTTRHEVAVASTSARFLAGGAEWRRDRVPPTKAEHMADGVAERDGVIQLVEVELTAKTLLRYQVILPDHVRRIQEGVDRVVYLGTPEASRAIAREADKLVHPSLRSRIVTLPILDERGRIVDDTFRGAWSTQPDSTHLAPPPPPLPDQLSVWGGRD